VSVFGASFLISATAAFFGPAATVVLLAYAVF